ncbi:MAG: 16S rRNA (cytosine(1402)-N(4))-methyltransferase RsmH [Gammaproteobacteria bacterium]|nr:16S rRNA (cytosine(1402)-N(4))-methyltransferase RsmH [Gammaproteobacteria bacterium]
MHESVLLAESIDALNIQPEGLYVDGTFGRGGHSQVILSKLGPSGRLIGIDKDLDAVKSALSDSRFEMVHDSFANMDRILNGRKANGILLDLGVSSPQLDQAERGFSFSKSGPLDMRMDQSQGESVAALLTHISIDELTYILREYGEERFARRIAEHILAAQALSPITDTLTLREIVAKAIPKKEFHKDPATRTFQALRIYINQELADLDRFLSIADQCLAPQGRLAIISFHSLEDRRVKQAMQAWCQPPQLPRHLPLRNVHFSLKMRMIARKIRASEEEIAHNPRARSAILRVMEKQP